MDYVIRRQSEQFENPENTHFTDDLDNNKFEWIYLRRECENLELEGFYNRYVERLQKSTLSLFLLIHLAVGIGHIILLVATQEDAVMITPDFYSYLISIISIVFLLAVAFKTQKNYWLLYIISYVAITVIILTDLAIPIYHAAVTFIRPALKPAYGNYVVFAIYIFLPLSDNYHAVIMGMFSSICYLIVMAMITYRLNEDVIQEVVSEGLLLLCLNIIGIFHRFTNEIAIRRTFLDRRECVQGNLLLKLAQNQEKDLLHSILPEHTAVALEHDIREVIKKLRQNEKNKKKVEPIQNGTAQSIAPEPPLSYSHGGAISKYYVEEHKNVSVLYADVVNYTFITTQLPVENLVEILHELFVKFDQASSDYNVLRIKFLGDCYYCVSGVPNKNPKHAKSCVNLGLRMIKDIKDVRNRRNLNIDMRIGIHSGDIIGGVIGACKWQYDIWSKDVDIANRMESTGVPGKVHVTRQTLELLDDEYMYEPGTRKAKEDIILKQNNIETFLISPDQLNYSLLNQDEISNRRVSHGISSLIKRKRKSKPTEISPRRNFMENSMAQYKEIVTKTNAEMEIELERMPVGRLQFHKLFEKQKMRISAQLSREDTKQNIFVKISPIFLFFSKNWILEIDYLKEKDVLFKYSAAVAFIIFLAIFTIQILNGLTNSVFWVVAIASLIVNLTIIPTIWFKKIWLMWQTQNEEDLTLLNAPTKKFFQIFYKISLIFSENTMMRYLTFLLINLSLLTCTLLNLLTTNDFTRFVNSWATTNCLTLVLCTIFIFSKIHFIFKFVVGFLITGFYGWIIFSLRYSVFNETITTNPAIPSNIAHFVNIVATALIFHFINRQTEYMSRVDFGWKQQLIEKQNEAEVTKASNSILLQNILPLHVADLYMTHQQGDGFYHEKYENVAIMFATITNYNNYSDAKSLSILNQLICDFDEVLLSHATHVKIEKIKVAGWTYMVACGLDPDRLSSSGSLQLNRNSLTLNGRRSCNHSVNNISGKPIVINNMRVTKPMKHSSRFSSNVVCILVQFALDLMKVLAKSNLDYFKQYDPGLLRVGISNGEVMAGVIGSNKPLYDVWGNTVNMASRMESTGVGGQIQVTSESAAVLESFGIACKYRGQTNVKGRGLIPTHFVQIDKKHQLITRNNCNDSFNESCSTKL